MDIEATGLDHGAGTHAFLIGWGRLDGQELLVRQALLREPAEEEAVLQLLVDELAQPFVQFRVCAIGRQTTSPWTAPKFLNAETLPVS